MKLKDSLRGFGIGIIFTTMVFLFTGAKKDISGFSKQDIIKKAQDFGMLTQEEVDEIILKYTLSATKTPESMEIISPEPKETSKPNEEAKSTILPTQTPILTLEPTQTPKPTVEPTPKPTPKPTQTPKPEEYVTVTISRGMYSSSVAKQFKEKGLIENAEEFDRYLCDAGYELKLRVGTYKIKKGSSYEEIAKKITK